MSEQMFVICPECSTSKKYESKDPAVSDLHRHNESMHDGDEVARFIGPRKQEFLDFLDYLSNEFTVNDIREIADAVSAADVWGILKEDQQEMTVAPMSELSQEQKKNRLDLIAHLGAQLMEEGDGE